jgi:predicted Zn finger-like uncharacterized protein
MILTCPSCDTRYSVDGSKFPAGGRMVRCAKCGHSWHQQGEPPTAPDAVAPAAISAAAPAAIETPAADPVTVDTARMPLSYPAEGVPLGPRLAVVAGWAGLIAVVLLIVVAAVRYRQDIALIWPQSAGVYSALGLPVNATGIDFRDVDYRRENEDGQVVLAVSGNIVNVGKRELPVPQTVRVTLSDASKRELYHWNFKPSVTVLKPGQSAPFTTRLSSPPAAARNLEVRFAKDGS